MTDMHDVREELWNAITHGIGAIASVAGGAALITLAAIKGNDWQLISAIVFTMALLLLYTASTLYHAIPHLNAKQQLKVFDHLANGTPKISQLPSIGLPALLQPQLLNVLKLPKEVHAESPITVIELENGDLMDTETGVVTPYIQLETPQTTIDLEDEALELVRLAKAQRQKYQLP